MLRGLQRRGDVLVLGLLCSMVIAGLVAGELQLPPSPHPMFFEHDLPSHGYSVLRTSAASQFVMRVILVGTGELGGVQAAELEQHLSQAVPFHASHCRDQASGAVLDVPLRFHLSYLVVCRTLPTCPCKFRVIASGSSAQG